MGSNQSRNCSKMKNTLTVTTLSDRRIQTDFVTVDGVQMMEIHRQGLSDAKVLTKLLEGKYFQNFKSEWQITFADEFHTIAKPTFE